MKKRDKKKDRKTDVREQASAKKDAAQQEADAPNAIITTCSPLSLGSGQADVNVDAEIVHDEYGLPYFPAKRLRGILYESACEVADMAALCGKAFLTQQTVDELFHHIDGSPVRLVISNFYLPNYETLCQQWRYLQNKYGQYMRPDDVLDAYTSIRYQTAVGDDGIVTDGSLHAIRVLDTGYTFTGTITIIGGTAAHEQALALALQNARQAGMKRNRGFGYITCAMTGQEKLVEAALREGGIY